MRVDITIDEKLLKRLDSAASKKSMSRSGFISYCVNNQLQRGSEASSDELLSLFRVAVKVLEDEKKEKSRELLSSVE